MSQQPQQTDAPQVPQNNPHNPKQISQKASQVRPRTHPPSPRARRLALLPLTIPDPSNSPSSNSSPSSPVSVVESDDSMEYDTSKSTAYAYFGELEANTGNRPQSGPLTMALLRAAEVINTSAGELSLHPSNPPP
ncbi:hypothetical protein EI94DRAFT_1797193 [Lactarius quietus]|nr:hypothetical protein EI94DRAFT_1797193 [Lactarius quietus]